jgi:hypothetical protein
MDHLSSGTHKHFNNLIDLVAGDHVVSEASVLGPCVGDDASPTAPVFTRLGPCVGDDLTMLGPCVGDDGIRGPRLNVLGPCVGDDS